MDLTYAFPGKYLVTLILKLGPSRERVWLITIKIHAETIELNIFAS